MRYIIIKCAVKKSTIVSVSQINNSFCLSVSLCKAGSSLPMEASKVIGDGENFNDRAELETLFNSQT
jgi:hypothetical protein